MLELLESDVLVLGERAALWLADEPEWLAFVRSTWCEPCDGRGYHVAGGRGQPLSFPTCYHCGGEGRPRQDVAA